METMKLQKKSGASTMLDAKIVVPAIWSSFRKLDPRLMARNPVMFVVEIVAALTTVIFIGDLVTGDANLGFTFQIILWLWFTVLFANFAEAVAEGRGKAQAESLKKTRTESQAKLLQGLTHTFRLVPGTSLKLRTDLSCTLFLSAPDDYDGGELEVVDTFGTHEVKLPAGDLALYPSGSLHRVLLSSDCWRRAGPTPYARSIPRSASTRSGISFGITTSATPACASTTCCSIPGSGRACVRQVSTSGCAGKRARAITHRRGSSSTSPRPTDQPCH